MILATFRLEPGALALAETLEQVPGLEVEAERVAAHATDWTMPCVWASGADFEAVDEALAADPSVASIVDATPFADEKYYQLDWSDEVEDRIDTYVDHEGSLLAARATADGWRARFRFVSRDQFDAFRETLHERGVSFDLLELTRPDDPRHSIGALTPSQREALQAAKEHGYYEVPRGISTRDLAAKLEMSHQNLSELLRRATEQLVGDTLNAPVDADGW